MSHSFPQSQEISGGGHQGREPLPEPYESAAHLVFGDRLRNEEIVSRLATEAPTLHRWRQEPRMIARVRFLTRDQQRQIRSENH